MFMMSPTPSNAPAMGVAASSGASAARVQKASEHSSGDINSSCATDRVDMAEGGVSRVFARPLSLEEQLSKFPTELLDSPCVESHLVKLTECFSEWQVISTGLELSKVEIQDIESNWPRNIARQRLEMFRKWQEKKRTQATLR